MKKEVEIRTLWTWSGMSLQVIIKPTATANNCLNFFKWQQTDDWKKNGNFLTE